MRVHVRLQFAWRPGKAPGSSALVAFCGLVGTISWWVAFDTMDFKAGNGMRWFIAESFAHAKGRVLRCAARNRRPLLACTHNTDSHWLIALVVVEGLCYVQVGRGL